MLSLLSRLLRLSSLSDGGTLAGSQHALRYHSDLILHLTRREFNLRYRRSVLGVFWSLLLPLVQLLIFVFLFQVVVPLNIQAYPAYVFSGLLPWTWFNSSVNTASLLFIANRALLRHPNLSPVVLIVVNTMSNLVSFLVGLPLLLIVLPLYHVSLSVTLLLLPLLLLIQTALTVGLSLALATTTVFYRDVQHLTGVTLMLLFYITPVFYQPEAAGDQYRWVFLLNPMAILIESYRAILYGNLPDWSGLLIGSIMSLGCLVGGYLLYARQRDTLFDYL